MYRVKEIQEEKPCARIKLFQNKNEQYGDKKGKKKKQIYPFKLFLKLKYFGHSIVRTKGRRTKEIKKKIIINFRQSNHSLQG